MRLPRSCGTLVHPTSFPSRYGMGDLGPEAATFIHTLAETGQTIWQVLPLGPVGYGNSPYASYSAFAGNHYLISPDLLVTKGLLKQSEADAAQLPVTTKADYDNSYKNKDHLFALAAERFYKNADHSDLDQLEEFKRENHYWLDDYALFITCSKLYGRKPWNQWERGHVQRKPAEMEKLRKKNLKEIHLQVWLQFEFFNQWKALKELANGLGIRVTGDIPIFVDHNSADVWANPHYFDVDEQGNRTLVAGVPPDYFSETGQLWGNPLYKWDLLERDGFSWWVERFRQMFELFDAVRVDHFRGFDAYWEVSAVEKTAIKGKWVEGPGKKLFNSIRDQLGELPIIAEDLGVMTPSVEELRDSFDFPGMKILQFAFDGDPANSFLPHNYHKNCVVYTGTHDNDTTIGWYQSTTEEERHRAREYSLSSGHEIHWDLIRIALFSVADQAIFPLQDFMNLDATHRMNIPGTALNNWMWRYTTEMLEKLDKNRIRTMIKLSNR